MQIKRYTLAVLVLIILVGAFVYTNVTQASMTLDFFGIPLPALSTAIWVVVPLVILYIASVAHMSFYALMGTISLRKYEKDYDKMIDAMVEAYLGKIERSHSFRTDRYKLLGSFVDHTTFFSNEPILTDNEKINEVVSLIDTIKRGEVAELKAYSLKPDNALVVQNDRNKYKKEELSAEDILSHNDKYNKALCEEVYSDFVETSPLYAIEQYKQFMTKETLFKVLSRVNADEYTLEISNEALISIFSELDLDKDEYIQISRALGAMIPEQRIKLFEMISEKNDEIMDAYLYTLFDLEMISLASEILRISLSHEYMNFKAYLALKECNKNFNINLFV